MDWQDGGHKDMTACLSNQYQPVGTNSCQKVYGSLKERKSSFPTTRPRSITSSLLADISPWCQVKHLFDV